jgi:hypothetical protein
MVYVIVGILVLLAIAVAVTFLVLGATRGDDGRRAASDGDAKRDGDADGHVVPESERLADRER